MDDGLSPEERKAAARRAFNRIRSAKLTDDYHPLWVERSNAWLFGFRGGVRLARRGQTLAHAGFRLDHTSERHQGLVMGWRLADDARATPMGHQFDDEQWGESPEEKD